MNETSEENPVFHYRAKFRSFANTLQKWLLYVGLLLSLMGLFGLLVANPSQGAYCIPCILKILVAAGVVLFMLGIAWGFYWRKKIRDEFRSKFGP